MCPRRAWRLAAVALTWHKPLQYRDFGDMSCSPLWRGKWRTARLSTTETPLTNARYEVFSSIPNSVWNACSRNSFSRPAHRRNRSFEEVRPKQSFGSEGRSFIFFLCSCPTGPTIRYQLYGCIPVSALGRSPEAAGAGGPSVGARARPVGASAVIFAEVS